MKSAARVAARRLSSSPASVPLRSLSLRGVVPTAVTARLPAADQFEVPTHSSSFTYRTRVDDRLSRLMYWHGVQGFERETTLLFEREAARGGVVVDVGANRGIFTLTALAASPDVRVVSIEPSPSTFAYLEELVELNRWSSRVELVQAAAADRPGSMQFHVPPTPFAPSARLVEASHRSQLVGEVIEVPVVVLDDLVDHADAVKIDVEGAEHFVLAGMVGLLERSGPDVFLEVLPEAENGACRDILLEHGYRLFQLTGDGEVERDDLVPDSTRRNPNYVCRRR